MTKPIYTLTGKTRQKRVLLMPWKKITLFEVNTGWTNIWLPESKLWCYGPLWWPDNRPKDSDFHT